MCTRCSAQLMLIKNDAISSECLVECNNCSKEFELSELIDVSGYFYCKDCIFVCNDCGETCSLATMSVMDGTCEGCCDKYSKCALCSEYVLSYDICHFNDQEYCENCLDQVSFVCDDCGERESESSPIRIGTSCICRSCSDNYYLCESCSNFFPENEIYESNQAYYCNDCYNDGIIDGCHPHSYRPELVFYGKPKNGIYFGIELEVEAESDESILNSVEAIEDNKIYCKRDSSLMHGFEIVSHPMSYDWLKNHQEFWNAMFVELKNLNCKSHDPGTCGMHIHVSKKPLTSLQIYRIMKLFLVCKGEILTMSQRGSVCALNAWSSIDDNHKNIIYKSKNKDGNAEKYRAIHISGETIEFRIFRGTLNQNRFWKNIEFIQALIEYSMSDQSIQYINWSNFVRFINKNKKKFKHLVDFLLEKGLIQNDQLQKCVS